MRRLPDPVWAPVSLLVAAVLVLATCTTPAARADDDGDLGPTTEAPWNPEQPVPAAETWETVLRFPGRVLSVPFSLLGAATRSSLVWVEDTHVVPQVQYLLQLHRVAGLHITTADLGERTGFGGAIGYEPSQLHGWLGLEMSASTAGYNRARVSAGEPRARLTYVYEWRSSDQFFGLGQVGDDAYDATYASRITSVEARTDWSWQQARTSRTEFGAWIGPRNVVQRDGREDEPLSQVFPSLAPALLDMRMEHLVYGARVAHDRRGGRPHWSHGWRASVAAQRFDKPVKALALKDAHTPEAAQFTRIDAMAEGGVSFMRDPRTLRLRARVVDNRGGGTGTFLLRDLARLGGGEGLSGFEPGRFHGTDLFVAKLSYVFPLAKHMEFDLHAEAGNVFDDLQDARLEDFEHSFGVALRPRLETAPLGAIGVDWSRETVRFRFSVGGVE